MNSALMRMLRPDETDVPYNVAWRTPSMDSLDSMPLSGRFGAGANVWVQEGSIWIYLGHSAAFDEEGRLLKLGCVRITPAVHVLGGTGFRQELHLAKGTLSIQQGDFNVTLAFASETLIYRSSSLDAQELKIEFATWRDRRRDGLLLDMLGKVTMQPDRVETDSTGFLWVHRNADYPVDVVARARDQGIAKKDVLDTTTRRVSGGAIAVAGGISAPCAADVEWQYWEGGAWTGRSAVRTEHTIAIHLGAKQDADPEHWRAQARAALDPAFIASAMADEQQRWDEFWSRSHIVINPTCPHDDPGFLIGRNYQLFRYMLACNRDGELPLLFNGGIFTTDNTPGRITGNNNDELEISKGGPTTPDFRRWMFCYFMSQNQRWMGWPALAGGDTDLLAPTLAFYRDRAVVAAARARTHGADGVVYPEPLDVWGLCAVAGLPDGLCGLAHLTYHFSMMLEHAWMALQAHDVLGIDLTEDLEWISGTVFFYDSYYRAETLKRTGAELSEDGKLVIYPACALEYANGATNPLDAVCGLTSVLEGLLALPGLEVNLRARLERIQPTLPDLPTGMRDERLSLLPACSFENEYNKQEPIEMYAAWPYRRVGITHPETLPLARDSWDTVPEHREMCRAQDFSWTANVVNMAALAWPEKAKTRAILKMANTAAPQARFPAFFGPGHDWLPDHNWGGSGMTGIQEMLLAPEPGPQGKLHLFGGWPPEWDVDFKLHAPGQTLVEAVVRNGRLETLRVTPDSRAQDVINWLGCPPPDHGDLT